MSEGINEWHHSQSTENTEMKRHTELTLSHFGIDTNDIILRVQTLIRTDLSSCYGIPPHRQGMHSLLLPWDATSDLSTTRSISWGSQPSWKLKQWHIFSQIGVLNHWVVVKASLKEAQRSQAWQDHGSLDLGWFKLLQNCTSPKADCLWGL